MKSQAYQVKVTKHINGVTSSSMLCDSRGKTIMCLQTAKKWADTYRDKFLRTNHKFGEVLIQILPY